MDTILTHLEQSPMEPLACNLPPDFIHEPPKGYRYEVIRKTSNVLSIWTVCESGFNYNSGDECYCIWGFCKTRTTKKGGTQHTYYAPINSNKVGKEVCISKTRPYTAMQLNLNPLEAVLFS
jgi:hypothetical protein